MYFGHISRVLLQALLRAMHLIDFTTLISIMSFIVLNVLNRSHSVQVTVFWPFFASRVIISYRWRFIEMG